MIELHTKINCECGQSYHALVVTDLPLNQKVERTTFCPFCGRPNDYKYKFSCDFTCKSKWKFWKKHFIPEHFSFCGEVGKYVFPRKCNCGKEILLIQERIK